MSVFLVPIDHLEFSAPRAERKIKIWQEMIRAGHLPPIQVREKPGRPGYWAVVSGDVAVEAARREGATSIQCTAP